MISGAKVDIAFVSARHDVKLLLAGTAHRAISAGVGGAGR
jgi:hypothetical protein